MPRTCPPTNTATRRPGKASTAARVGSTLVERLSSTNSTPPTVATGRRRLSRCSYPAAAPATARSSLASLGAEGDEAGAGDQGVAVVVGAEQPELRGPVVIPCALDRHPLDAGPEQRAAVAQQRAVAVGDREVRTGEPVTARWGTNQQVMATRCAGR